MACSDVYAVAAHVDMCRSHAPVPWEHESLESCSRFAYDADDCEQ